MAIRFFEALLLSAFMAIVGYGLGRLVGVLVQLVLEESANSDSVRAMIAHRAKIERGLEARLRDRRAEMAKLDRNIKELVRKRLQHEAAAAKSMAVADQVMRVIGEEVTGRQRFLALVFNKYLAGGSGGAHQTLIDPAWAIAQEIEIWGKSMTEARSDLEKRYPPAFGFSVSSLVEAPRDDMFPAEPPPHPAA